MLKIEAHSPCRRFSHRFRAVNLTRVNLTVQRRAPSISIRGRRGRRRSQTLLRGSCVCVSGCILWCVCVSAVCEREDVLYVLFVRMYCMCYLPLGGGKNNPQ